ncbi:hypothetical protein TI04_03290 [Achromatium sp. WMS2]|nr:hypothetical protein TI04_03290 [Achromatium sp. WMS2]
MRIFILVLIALLAWLQFRLWQGPGSITDVQRLNNEVMQQQQELERLNNRNEILEAEVLDLKFGLEALEERARTELEMIRQGEVFYQTVTPNPKATNPDSAAKSTP